MSRSSKKGPWVEERLMTRIEAMNQANQRTMVRTWSRGCKLVPVFVSESMVGHKLGEFAPTRTYRGHDSKGKVR